MSQNPLQQYFRQPKIYVKLPSQGMFSKPGAIAGDVNGLPVFGMTGMDEIIMKTPDSLLSGESVAQVIKSCCPGILDSWELSVLDTDVIFSAIRIATYGNLMSVSHTCNKCQTENEYDLDLNRVVEYFSSCKYDNKISLENMVIKTQPLTYKQSTMFSLKNFSLQQRLSQAEKLTDKDEQQKIINDLFKELATLQNELYFLSIESVEVGNTVVDQKEFIKEWLENCDKSIFDAIKKQIDKNRDTWTTPSFPVKCSACDTSVNLKVDLDQSNFFV